MASKAKNDRVRGLYKPFRSPYWWLRYTDQCGVYHQESTGVTDREVAKTFLAKRRVQVAEGRFLDKKENPYGTLAELVTWYLDRPDVSERDHRTCKPVLQFFGPDEPISRINTRGIMDYRRWRSRQIRRQGDRPVAKSTINRELAFIKAMFNRAIDAEIASKNPMRGVKLFPEHRRTRILTRDEIERLLIACQRARTTYLYPVVFLGIMTGIRRGALLRLRWPDIDFERGVITVHKTKRGQQRRVPLSPRAATLLGSLPRSEQSDHVFYKANGKPLRDIRTAFDNACKRAGLTDVVFHALRHCFGSLLAEQGIDAHTIMHLLGHSTLDTSLIYVHISDARMQHAVSLLPSFKVLNDEKSGT